MVLLAGAWLMIRGFVAMLRDDIGFNPHNALSFRPQQPNKKDPHAAAFNRPNRAWMDEHVLLEDGNQKQLDQPLQPALIPLTLFQLTCSSMVALTAQSD
jgi:hypothetical protein